MYSRKNALETTLRAAALLLAVGTTNSAWADSRAVFMNFSDPGNPSEARVTIQFEDTAKPDGDPNKYRYVIATIPPGTDARQKRDIILSRLELNGFSVRASGETGLILPRIDSKTKVYFNNGGTMEHDVITCQAPMAGEVIFNGFFEPFTPDQQPAVFTAGLVTDVGQLACTISAAELNFQTEGPIICQALFQRIAPQAPQYGAQVDCLGDRLHITFDPAYTTTNGGVAWGTTSPSEGCGGALVIDFPELRLHVDDLRIGQNTTVRVDGAEPQERIYVCYGLSTGDFYVPQFNLTIDLAAPVLVGSTLADGNGQGQLTLPIPPNPRLVGLDLAWQALTFDKISQVEPKTIR